jgi:hypothetical protein
MTQVPPFALFEFVAFQMSNATQANNAKSGTLHVEAGHAAALRWQCEEWHLARRSEKREKASLTVFDVRARFEKGLRVRVPWTLEDLRGRAIFDDGAVVHDSDPFADLADDLEVVGDEDHRELVSLSQLGDQIEDLRLDRHVERGDGLIEDQQTRPGCERSGDCDALPFATRECTRELICGGRRQTHLIEKLGDAFSLIGFATDGVGDEGLGDDGADTKAGVEGQARVLKHGLESAA